jgi:probable dihydroxyacetone kinase regulator
MSTADSEFLPARGIFWEVTLQYMPKSTITKSALADGMKELMKSKKLSKITIADITTQCDISRNTFYYHFRDKYALVNWIFSSEALPIVNTFSSPECQLEGFIRLCRYLLNNRHFYLEAFEYTGQNSLTDYLLESYFELMKLNISTYYEQYNLKLSTDDLYIVARLEAHAYVGIIMDWVHAGMRDDYMRPPLKIQFSFTL